MVTGRHMYFDLDSGRFIVHKKKVFSIGDANAYWTEFSKVVDGTYIIKDFYFLGCKNDKYKFFFVCSENDDGYSYLEYLYSAKIYNIDKDSFIKFYNFLTNIGIRFQVLKYQSTSKGLLDRIFYSFIDTYFVRLKLSGKSIRFPNYSITIGGGAVSIGDNTYIDKNGYLRYTSYLGQGFVIAYMETKEKDLKYEDIGIMVLDTGKLVVDFVNFCKLFKTYSGGL